MIRPAHTTRLLAATGALAVGLAACGGGAAGGDTAAADVTVTGTDGLQFTPTDPTADPGSVAIELTSQESIEHNIVIEEVGDTMVVEAQAGETAVGTVELEAGTYTFYCDVPGHRAAGMEGTLTVE